MTHFPWLGFTALPHIFMKSMAVNFGRLTITRVNSSKLSIKWTSDKCTCENVKKDRKEYKIRTQRLSPCRTRRHWTNHVTSNQSPHLWSGYNSALISRQFWKLWHLAQCLVHSRNSGVCFILLLMCLLRCWRLHFCGFPQCLSIRRYSRGRGDAGLCI